MTNTAVAPGPALVILAEVFVPGHPKTKGSLTFKGDKHVEEAVAGSSRWRALVAERLKSAALVTGYSGRVGVRVVSHMQTATGKEGWLERAKAWIISRLCGDVDKLARNVLDALTDSGVIGDDAQVWDLMSSKRLVMPGMMAGQMIQVWAIPDSAPW